MAADTKSPSNPQARVAERREVTALSYDLVESTRLAALLDPEEFRTLQRSIHEICTTAITRYEGYVGDYAGDGAMAYFGYPQAHEDDPERAVRAGLAIIAGCQVFNATRRETEVKVAIRVGIARGLVVAGNFAGNKAFDQDDVVGIAPNLAFKLQAAAPANSVVVSGAVRELTAALFLCRARPALTIAGFDQPVQVWQVSRARNRVIRSWSSRLQSVTPLVAREEEIAIICRRWEMAARGEGQVVLLSGEPGIGKSRIAAEIRHHVAQVRPFVITLQCSAQRADTAFHPLAGFFERVVGLGPRWSPEATADRLARLLGMPKSEVAEAAFYIARLLTPPSMESEQPLLAPTPEQIKQKTMAMLIGLVERMSRQHPVLVVCEDVHWIDPTSQEFLDFLFETVNKLRILVLITFRSSYKAPWVGQSHVTQLALNRLNDRQCAAMVGYLAHSRNIPQAMVDRIVTLADGVPLFVEELSHSVFGVDPKHDTDNNRPSIASSSDLVIPATLSDSLTARLDQLGSGRRIAQICSVVGRSFAAPLVGKVAEVDEATLERALDRFVALGLASVRGRSAQAVYTFRHALIQESAYCSILHSDRKAMHHRVAELLATSYPGTSDAAPEILAYHYEEAGEAAQSIGYLREAARAATATSANVEAVRLLEKALRLLVTLPKGKERDANELALLVSLGPPQIAISGTAAPDVQKLYRHAVELCDKLPNSSHHFAAHWGWWYCAADYKESLERANRLSALTSGLNDEELELQAHHCQWASQFSIGEQVRCCEHIDRGLAIYERGDYRAHAAIYGGHDPKVCGLGERALSQWLMGLYDRSLDSIEESVAHARALQHSGSIGHSLFAQTMLYRFRGDAVKVLELAKDMTSFAEQSDFKGLMSRAKVFRGWAVAKLGDTDAGVALIDEGLAEHRAANSQEDFPVYFEMLAEAYGAKGQPEPGIRLLDEGIAMAERTGLQYWTAELLRRKGMLLLQQSGSHGPEALACFDRAIAIAEAQGARALQLRALCSKAGIEARRGSRAATRVALASLYGSFTEGLDCADLSDAQQLIKSLS
jgi:predicted ATPase/class 3 adenylate cyclase